jgi:hypothetical protein
MAGPLNYHLLPKDDAVGEEQQGLPVFHDCFSIADDDHFFTDKPAQDLGAQEDLIDEDCYGLLRGSVREPNVRCALWDGPASEDESRPFDETLQVRLAHPGVPCFQKTWLPPFGTKRRACLGVERFRGESLTCGENPGLGSRSWRGRCGGRRHPGPPEANRGRQWRTDLPPSPVRPLLLTLPTGVKRYSQQQN